MSKCKAVLDGDKITHIRVKVKTKQPVEKASAAPKTGNSTTQPAEGKLPSS